MKVFISCSFNEKDLKPARRIRRHLKEILNIDEKDIIIANEPRKGEWIEKIRNYIRTSDIVVGLFAQKDKKRGSDSFTTVPWVIAETNYALGLNKEVIGLVEDGVDRDDTGFLLTHDLPRFNKDGNRKTSDGKRSSTAEKQLIKSLKQEVYMPLTTRKILEATICIQILQSGAGVQKNRFKVRCLNRKNFQPTNHSFSVVPSTINTGKIGSLEELKKTSISKMYAKPFFRFDFIDLPIANPYLYLEDITPEGSDENKFQVKLPREVKTGDIYIYEYIWGSPNAFFTDYKTIKENNLENESIDWEVINPYGILTMELKFEKPIVPLEEPSVVISESADVPGVECPVKWDVKRDSIFYSYKSPPLSLEGARGRIVSFRWKPPDINNTKV